MRIYSRYDLIWDKHEKTLSLGKEVLVRLQPHPEYENMYYIVWYDASKSKDFYNITRALEHAFSECLKELNNTTEDT